MAGAGVSTIIHGARAGEGEGTINHTWSRSKSGNFHCSKASCCIASQFVLTSTQARVLTTRLILHHLVLLLFVVCMLVLVIVIGRRRR